LERAGWQLEGKSTVTGPFNYRKKKEVYYWLPQPGPQAEAATCPADEIFFGGTRGGGKSDTVVGRQVRGALKYGNHWNGIVIRRKYKDFAELRRRFDELITQGLPATRVGGENQVNYVRFKNGALIVMQAIMRLELADSLQGHQYTEISIDEAPTIPFIAQLIDLLKGCLRSPHGVPCHMFLTGNPGGAGAAQIKAMYIPKLEGGELKSEEGTPLYIQKELKSGDIHEFSRIFIRSTLWDNKILIEQDPSYEARLRSINNPQLVDAWLGGKWNVFVGQAFNFNERHIVAPVWPIPDYAPIYMTFDWGFGAPFSIGWWWVDGEDRIYRFAEWYGWDKVTPNVGLRLTDAEVAEGIVEREKKMGIWNRPITRLAGPDCFNKKPDYKGGGQGPATADEFRWYAEKLQKEGDNRASLNLIAGDPAKQLKIKQFRNRLQIPKDPEEMPPMVVYNTCRQFIRIIPSLCVDELTAEYLEKGQELHPFDESCHVCMARPSGMPVELLDAAEKARKEASKIAKLDAAAKSASLEWKETVSRINAEDDDELF